MSPKLAELSNVIQLPSSPTPFIGREAELQEIEIILEKRGCQLLTLLGPGGIGKTRLALEAARRQADQHSHGIFFVNLQPVTAAEIMISTIADHLSFPLNGQEDWGAQLHRYLKNKNLLLLLDNVEQLLPDNGAIIISEMIASAPGLRILATSRAALNIQEEWFYHVPGLSLPDRDNQELWAKAESVQLFCERAQQVKGYFTPTSADLEAVVKICHLVGGIPLALQLAATWTKMLTCTQIADRIIENLDLLATDRKNIPDRHQSMRAIFNQTWRQLLPHERDVFKKLAIFRKGFSIQAAQSIAGANIPTLSQLQDKSLIRWDDQQRYFLHELLRQHAAEKLEEEPHTWQKVERAHSQYYSAFLRAREEALMDARQVQATKEIQSELENIRLAWREMIAREDLIALQNASFALGNFYQFQSRYAEGLKAFEAASQKLESLPASRDRDLALINCLMVRSWFYLRFGKIEAITAVMQQSLDLHERLNIDPLPGYVTNPSIMLAFVGLIRGQFDAAESLAHEVRETSARLDQSGNLEFAYHLLAQCKLAQGEYEAAQDWALAAYRVAQEMGDRWFMAYILNTMADLARLRQEFTAAQKYYQTSYDIRREFNDAEGMAVALNHLSGIALRQEDFAAAQSFYAQSLQLYQNINDTGGLATSYRGLARIAMAQKEYQTARTHYQKALTFAGEIWYVQEILHLFLGIGEFFCRIGHPRQGVPLFHFVQQVPAANQELKNKAEYLINNFKLILKAHELGEAKASSRAYQLENLYEEVMVTLPLINVEPVDEAAQSPAADPNQALVEPLTPRELDVLQLLGQGLTNQEIAAQLIIAKGTVKYYTGQIYAKLQVRNRVQAVAAAEELDLI